MDHRLLLRRIRIVVYGIVIVLVVTMVWRFDVISLPEEGCSPLRRLAPGDRIVVDVHPGELREGDVVFFRAGAGEIRFGEVQPVPPSAPEETWAAVAAGALWIVGDDADCPARDSRVLGPIEREAVEGRLVLVFPW